MSEPVNMIIIIFTILDSLIATWIIPAIKLKRKITVIKIINHSLNLILNKDNIKQINKNISKNKKL